MPNTILTDQTMDIVVDDKGDLVGFVGQGRSPTMMAKYSLDPTTGAVTGLVGPSGSDFLVVSSSAPNNDDGRPDGTIYFHIQP